MSTLIPCLQEDMSYGFNHGLVSLIVASWGNDTSAYMVVANTVSRGAYSCTHQAIQAREEPGSLEQGLMGKR